MALSPPGDPITWSKFVLTQHPSRPKDQTPRSRRAPSTEPIDTASLRLGACLAIARCYYDGNQKGCLTTGCGDVSLLGQVCSCNAEVQAALTVQLRKGQDMWPVPKCSYS